MVTCWDKWQADWYWFHGSHESTQRIVHNILMDNMWFPQVYYLSHGEIPGADDVPLRNSFDFVYLITYSSQY